MIYFHYHTYEYRKYYYEVVNVGVYLLSQECCIGLYLTVEEMSLSYKSCALEANTTGFFASARFLHFKK